MYKRQAVDEANESRDEDNQLSVSEITYGADSTTPVEEVRNAADALADGEISSVVETDTGYYGIQMVKMCIRDRGRTAQAVFSCRNAAIHLT